MNDKAIITLSDSNYFEMLNELIESIKRFPDSKNVSICVLDAGLTEEQKKLLKKKFIKLKRQRGTLKCLNIRLLERNG